MNRKIKKGGRIWDRIYAFEKMKNHLDSDDAERRRIALEVEKEMEAAEQKMNAA